MTLPAGSRLGPFEIVAPLGAGGMGEVYRARDTRLGREVAVKVLPAEVAGDPERLRRFEQEAKAASSLNHPNILTVHDFGSEAGVAYLVTELLEGESLRDLVRRGPLPERRAIELAIEVAKGLAAAHAKGIVHRDLKPENLFVTRDGGAKILDFGLARVERPSASADTLADASTLLETVAGSILGTPGYMAPEQVRGERADARADLFALGCVLYEMLAGSSPFRRGSTIESLSAILNEAPAELSSVSRAQSGVARLVERLLEKDADRRFRSAADLAFALEALREAPSEARSAPPGGVRSVATVPRWRLPAAGLLLLAAGIVAGTLIARGKGSAPRASIRFEMAPPVDGNFHENAEVHNLALAPDGASLAFVAAVGNQVSLWVRDFSRIEPREIAGTEGARSPFWSPDGGTLAFFAGGKLKRVAREGGPVQVVCDVQGANTGSWGRSGTIVYSQGFGPDDGLFRVAASGGTPVRMKPAGDLPRWIEFLPDGRHFLYWDRKSETVTGNVWVGDLESGESKRLLDDSSQARYAEPGWLLFIRAGALLAQRFDAAKLELSGEPVPLASSVPYFFNGWSAFTVTAGALAFQVQPASPPLLWLDRHGRELGRVGPAARYLAVRLAPDERAAAVTVSDPVSAFTDVWIVDLARGGSTRLSDEPLLEWSPAWAPQGDRVAYTSVTAGPRFEVRIRRVTDGRTLESWAPHASFLWARAWTGSGLFLEANEPQTGWDLLQAPESGEPLRALLATPFGESYPSPSPDGRWLAFHSDESGGGEIELLRLGAPARPIRVSRGAQASVPRWRADGRELYYVSAEGWLSAISVGAGDPPALGEPVALFRVDLIGEDGFDVTADGQRFLIAATRPASSLPVQVALDWQQGLERR